MFVPFFDIKYLIFSIPAIAVGVIASLLLKYWTGKYSRQENLTRLSGVDAVERIARKENLSVRLEVNSGNLTDHYDPRNQTISLSRDVAQLASIASVAIAAHEMGHAIQHQKGSVLMSFRNLIVPMVNIGTNIGYFLLIIGIIIGLSGLAWFGIILFSFATIFSLLTLPIELDASRRALNIIKSENLLLPSEIGGANKVLLAAALTYVAATLQSVGSLLYFVLRVQGMSRKE